MTDRPQRAHDRVIRLSDHDRALLQRWARSRALAARVVLRSRLVLLLADGLSMSDVAGRLGTTRATVRLWRRRFESAGLRALLQDAPGRGRKPSLSVETRQALAAHNTVSGTSGGGTSGTGNSGTSGGGGGASSNSGGGARKTLAEQARELGVSPSTVSRWRRAKPPDARPPGT